MGVPFAVAGGVTKWGLGRQAARELVNLGRYAASSARVRVLQWRAALARRASRSGDLLGALRAEGAPEEVLRAAAGRRLPPRGATAREVGEWLRSIPVVSAWIDEAVGGE